LPPRTRTVVAVVTGCSGSPALKCPLVTMPRVNSPYSANIFPRSSAGIPALSASFP